MSDPAASVRDRTSSLCAALAQWADPGTAQDGASRPAAARTALDAIDALLRDLYLLRGRLVREIHQADGVAHRRIA
jgi:hypothetical protein